MPTSICIRQAISCQVTALLYLHWQKNEDRSEREEHVSSQALLTRRRYLTDLLLPHMTAPPSI